MNLLTIEILLTATSVLKVCVELSVLSKKKYYNLFVKIFNYSWQIIVALSVNYLYYFFSFFKGVTPDYLYYFSQNNSLIVVFINFIIIRLFFSAIFDYAFVIGKNIKFFNKI